MSAKSIFNSLTNKLKKLMILSHINKHLYNCEEIVNKFEVKYNNNNNCNNIGCPI